MLLRQMKYFLAAVYCKSFNEAAKQCFISQPSFSLQIKQLEKELGVKLINRNNCCKLAFFHKSIYLNKSP